MIIRENLSFLKNLQKLFQKYSEVVYGLNTAENLSQSLLENAIQNVASDIHFYPLSQHTNVYFRIHGSRLFHKQFSKQTYQLLIAYYKFASGMDIGETRKPQDGTITYTNSSGKYSLRLSTLPVHQAESLVIRILPQKTSLQLDQLLLFPNQHKVLKKWI